VNDADIPAIAALYYNTVRRVNARDYNPQQIDAWAPEIAPNAFWQSRFVNYQVFVAEHAMGIVGFAEFDNLGGRIDCLYVHCEKQRAGIGTALLAHIEDQARSRNLHRLFADVSITARPFFAKNGFTVVAEQESPYQGCSFKQYAMEKALTGR
jgi:putative acetyltransferase